MIPLRTFMSTGPDLVLPVVVDTAVKGTIILMLAMLAARGLQRRPAALRHLIWTMALFSLIFLPILSALDTGLQVTIPVTWSDADEPTTAPNADPAPRAVAELHTGQVTSPPMLSRFLTCPQAMVVPPTFDALPLDPTLEAAAPARPVSTEAAAPTPTGAHIWFLGAMLAVLPLGLALLRLRHLRRTALAWGEGSVLQVFRRLAMPTGTGRPIALLRGDGSFMPMTWGVWRPVILLPAEAESWPAERLRVVLLHELAHVRRWDCLTQVLALLVRACFWFHPLVWLATSRMRIEQERACDDAVVNAGIDEADYAQHLLGVLARLPSSYFVGQVVLAISRSVYLERRLRAILDRAIDHRPLSRRWAFVTIVAAGSLLLPLGSLRIQDQPSAGAAIIMVTDHDGSENAAQPRTLEQLRENVFKNYVKPVDEKTLTVGAIKGMLETLHDPYCEYLEPARLEVFQRQNMGDFIGIGVQIKTTDQQCVVVTPLEGSPAFEAGLRPGDIIVSVDGRPTQGLQDVDIAQRIVGKVGTVVKLTVRRPDGSEVETEMTRRLLRVPSVGGFRRDAAQHWDYLLNAEHKIGYARLHQFSAATSQELRGVLEQLKKQEMKGLILDLRNCPGGLLSAAVEVSNLFIKEGTIVTLNSRNGEKAYKAEAKNFQGDFPLTVLIDSETASAAEIVAGALKDHDRAVLIGDRTYGKGTVQSIVNLPAPDGALKLTTAFYSLPSGRIIQRTPEKKDWGVDPTDGDFLALSSKQTERLQINQRERDKIGMRRQRQPEANLTPAQVEKSFADPQLAAALQALLTRLAQGDFPKVGKPNTALEARLAQRERLHRVREVLSKSLDKVNKELDELEHMSTDH